QLLLLDGIRGLVLAAAQDRDEIAPALRLPVEGLEGAEDLEVRRVELEHLQVGGDGAVDVAELLAVDAGGLDPQGAREIDVLGGLGELLDELREGRELLLLEGEHL